MSMSIPLLSSLRHLVGKCVVVVGGSSGIGFAVAQSSLEHGAHVVIASRSQEKVDGAVSRLRQTTGGEVAEDAVEGRAFDVTDHKALEAFWDGVGKFDHLVWTAGDRHHISFLSDSFSILSQQFDVRFWGPVLSAQYVFNNGLISQEGSITMTTGAAVWRPLKGWAMVNAVAGAIMGITRGLAVDLAPVRVNTIATGMVDTEFRDHLPPDRKAFFLNMFAEKSLTKRIALPAEEAEAYLFAMKCSSLTGQTLNVERGELLA